MSGVNRATILGRLGKDPEVKVLDGGQTVTNMSIATSESWTDKDGTKQERTEWHRVTAWGKLAEICGKYLTKGRQVYLDGKIQTRSWETDNGEKRYTTEIVAQNVQFLSAANEQATSNVGGQTVPNHAPQRSAIPSPPPISPDSEIPF